MKKLVYLVNSNKKITNKFNQITHKDEKYNDIKLENDLFNKEIHFKYQGSEIDIAQFFGIKVQEDFVTWNQNYCNLTNQSYGFSNYAFFNEKQFPIPFHSFYESILVTCNYNTLDKITSLQFDVLTNSLINIISSYLNDWFKAVQLPLLVTGINREWYQNDGNYKVWTNENINEISIDNSSSVFYLINKWRKFFSFSSKVAKRDYWIKIVDETKINDNLISYNLDLNSYSSRILIDNVWKEGHTIPVKYESFYKINEAKKAYKFQLNNWLDNSNMQFIINQNIPDKTITRYCVEVRNIMQDAKIFLSDPLLVKNEEKYQTILKKLVQFNKQNEDFIKHCTLIISNQYDGLVLVNDVDWFEQNNLPNEIINLVSDLNS